MSDGEDINSQILKDPLTGAEEYALNDSKKDRKTNSEAISNLSNKRSLEKDLIESPDEPDDNDRVIIGTRNVLWSYFEVLIQNILSIFDYISFNTDPPIIITDAGTIQWNNKEYTINVVTGLGATIQVGQEVLMLYYNDTGVKIDNFTVLHPKGAIEIGGVVVPTPDIATASKWELCEGTLSIATHDILDGELGFTTTFGKARDGDSTGWTAGSQLWLSADGSGLPTVNKPTFPDYSISLGGSLSEDASEGVIFVSKTKSVGDTFQDAWDGAIRETFNFTTSSDGLVVTGLLENVNPLNNLTLIFSDGAVFYTFDTTSTPQTIELTPGTDDNEQKNFVYIPIATKVLTVSTSGWPTTEHCRVAELDVQSAITTLDDGGVLGNQNTNDHIKKEDDNGHILHGFAWIREQYATMRKKYNSEATFDNTGGNGYINITGGFMLQAHLQELQTFSMPSDSIRSWTDSSGNRPKYTNLTSITQYSDGTAWNNAWGKIVVWRVGNKTGEYAPVMFNLPSGGYNSESAALADLSNKADYSIPDNFITKGVLIAAFTFRISGGVITYSTGYEDLRGQQPNTTAGGGGGGGGVTTYSALTDTPSTRVGQASKIVRVSDSELADEYDFENYNLSFALSDETSDLTTDNDSSVRVVNNQTIESIMLAVNVPGTGSSILCDVLVNGATILTTPIELTSSSFSTIISPPQISDTSLLAYSDIIKADITQIGATTSGAGAKIYFKTKLA